MTIAFFALSGLDLMDCISSFEPTEKKEIIDWIYGLQIEPEDGRAKKVF